ncbi:MAG: hypothetical protein PHS37_02720 [Candidatus Omnitrophica bacterium]|nr:hypothetical protein [Candidatus Omnitrophota bacterium]
MGHTPRVVGIIQGRVKSARLPGKVLADLNGWPAIGRIVRRVMKCEELDKIIVATSTNPENDAIERLGRENGWDVFRGSEDDCLSRFTAIIKKEDPGIVVRINADNFAICPEVVSHGIRELVAKRLDVCTSFIDNTYPFGSGAEVSTADALMRIHDRTRSGPLKYREHIYLYAYEHREAYKVGLLEAPEHFRRPDINLSVDTAGDYERVKALYAAFPGRESDFGLKEIIEYWDRLTSREAYT